MKGTPTIRRTATCGATGSLVLAVAILFLAGCGSAHRKEGIQALQNLQSDVHGLHILVSAGVTKQEYSQRFEDVLLKLGDLDQREARTVLMFPQSEQSTVKTVFTHLSVSMAAYKKARDYFGTSFDGYGCEQGCNFFGESDYAAVRQEFPTLAPLNFGPEFTWLHDNDGNVVGHSYRRSDMLQALWVVAGAEDDQAKRLIDTLNDK